MMGILDIGAALIALIAVGVIFDNLFPKPRDSTKPINWDEVWSVYITDGKSVATTEGYKYHIWSLYLRGKLFVRRFGGYAEITCDGKVIESIGDDPRRTAERNSGSGVLPNTLLH